MFFVLPAALALALAPAPSPADSPSPGCAAATARLGTRGAPNKVDVYMDPTAAFPLTLATELRRLAADRPGELDLELHVVSTAGSVDPRADEVRLWVVSMTAQGKFFEALRVIRRDGTDRVYVRLLTEQDRVELATEVGLSPASQERWPHDACARAQIDADTSALEALLFARHVAISRLPVIFVADVALEDNAILEKLRPALGRLDSRRRREALRPAPQIPPPRGVSNRLRRPALGGATLGGIGLRHRFVVMARDEDDPNLFMLLPPVLRFRDDEPGTLTVQVVARGPSWGATSLRLRLCAARQQGLVAAYVRWLATDPSSRALDPATKGLLEALDTVPSEACADEPDPAELGLPDGAWLDGLPRTRSELEILPDTLRLLEASTRPLSPLIGADVRKDPL